jgi:hypothetical protein
MNSAARQLENTDTELGIVNPAGQIDERYNHWLGVTGSPEASATLVLAEVQSASRPAANEHVGNQRKSDALNPRDVAKELRVSPDTVLTWVRTKQLPAANIATGSRPRWIIQRSDLDSFLKSRQPQPTITRRNRRDGGFRKYRD